MTLRGGEKVRAAEENRKLTGGEKARTKQDVNRKRHADDRSLQTGNPVLQFPVGPLARHAVRRGGVEAQRVLRARLRYEEFG